MRFLCEAQLPQRLARALTALGHESIHTIDLPNKNRSSDAEVIAAAAAEDRIVSTKDADFVDSYLLRGEPQRLLLVSTGNISNVALLALFQSQLSAIEEAFQAAKYVELTSDSVVAHG